VASMTFSTFSLALASGLAVSGRVARTSGLLTKLWGSTSGWGWIAIHRRYRLRVVFNQIELGGMVGTTELPQPEPLFILHVLRRGIWLETESSKVQIGLNPKQLYRSSLYGSTKHLRACPMDIRSFGNRGPIHHGPIRRPSFSGLLLVSSRSTLVTIYKL